MEFLKDFEHGEIVYVFNRVKNFDGPVHQEPITPQRKVNRLRPTIAVLTKPLPRQFREVIDSISHLTKGPSFPLLPC